MSIIIFDDTDIPRNQERCASIPSDARSFVPPEHWNCQSCWSSVPAIGSLGGIWLFCDHPESFKRYVRPHEACECWWPPEQLAHEREKKP